MRALIVLLSFALLSILSPMAIGKGTGVLPPPPPTSGQLPYSVSGDYSGGGWLCRIDNGPFNVLWSRTHVSCTGPDSVHSEQVAITWGCPSTDTVYPLLVPYFPFNFATDPALRILGFGYTGGTATLTIAVGLAGALYPPASPPPTATLIRVASRTGSGCGTYPATTNIGASQ